MAELTQAIQEIIEKNPFRFVLSLPRGANPEYRRASLRGLHSGWQLEKQTATQVFHTNIPSEQLAQTLEKLLVSEFRELHAFDETGETRLKMTKKEKVLVSRSKTSGQPSNPPPGHNREKKSLLPQGTPIPALEQMGIFTSTGHLAKGMGDKYRQVNRFVELVDDLLRDKNLTHLEVVDFGCGKSTLTFVLYHYLRYVKEIDVHITGIDQKEAVIQNCNQAAQKAGYERLEFVAGDVSDIVPSQPVDMVVALHACDTATDVALGKAVEWDSRFIMSVPCCQHQLNAQMQLGELPILSRYGVVKERTAALMTDAIRANLLMVAGYKTQLMEFVDLAHTPKNLLIRAEKAALPRAARKQALEEVRQLTQEFGFSPALLGMLEQQEKV